MNVYGDLKKLYKKWKEMDKSSESIPMGHNHGVVDVYLDPSLSITSDLFAEYLYLRGIEKCPVCHSQDVSIPEAQEGCCMTYSLPFQGIMSGTSEDHRYIESNSSHENISISYQLAIECDNCGHKPLFDKELVIKNIEKMIGTNNA